MATKPTGADLNLSWSESVNSDVLEPSIAKQRLGFQEAEQPANNYFNWFSRTTSRWLEYLRDIEASELVWTALQTFNGTAGDDEAAVLSSTVVVTTRRLLWVMGGGDGRKIRFYRTSTGTFEVTFNAWWRVSDSKWVADAATIGARLDASRLVLADVGASVWRPARDVGASHWNDSDWEKLFSGPDNGLMKFCATATSAGGSNPANTEAMVNTLCAKNTPKAWANLHVALGVVTVTDGFNLAYDSSPDAYTIRLKFPTGGAMPNGDYLVLGNMDLAAKFHCVKASRTTAGFDVKFAQFDLSGYLNIPPINPGFDFDVLVFGKQTS